MKKRIIILLALLSCTVSHAQLGITGGLTSSFTSLKEASDELLTKQIHQYHVGVSYRLGFGDVFALQPGVVYNVKGASLKAFNISEVSFKTGYIEVPIQLQLGFPIGKLIRLYAIGEPFAGYAVNNSIQYDNISENTWDNVRNRFEYGVSAGAGIELFGIIQINVKRFWNLGNTYTDEFSFKSLKSTLGDSSNGGISISASLFL